ncbi:MAG: hypothetical protein E2O39_11330 [Planctomycetota bacterium]|nr:MAG: hypothetical protein E2O39_11330 [Planctomycetota bacterium]
MKIPPSTSTARTSTPARDGRGAPLRAPGPWILALLVGPPAACFLPSSVGGEPLRRGVTVAYGERDFDDDDEYPGVQDPSVLGLEFDAYELRRNFGWEASVQYAQDDDSRSPSGRIDVETFELAAGLRRTWRPYELGVRGLYPYVGGGASLLYTDLDDSSPGGDDDSDFDVGLYVHFGFYAEFFDHIRWGLDYRFMREDFLDGGGLDVDYDQFTVTIGYTF